MMLMNCNYVIVMQVKKENVVENVMLVYAQTVVSVKYCCDKPKFGGRNTLKQCCVKRRCLNACTSSIPHVQGAYVHF